MKIAKKDHESIKNFFLILQLPQMDYLIFLISTAKIINQNLANGESSPCLSLNMSSSQPDQIYYSLVPTLSSTNLNPTFLTQNLNSTSSVKPTVYILFNYSSINYLVPLYCPLFPLQ